MTVTESNAVVADKDSFGNTEKFMWAMAHQTATITYCGKAKALMCDGFAFVGQALPFADVFTRDSINTIEIRSGFAG